MVFGSRHDDDDDDGIFFLFSVCYWGLSPGLNGARFLSFFCTGFGRVCLSHAKQAGNMGVIGMISNGGCDKTKIQPLFSPQQHQIASSATTQILFLLLQD
ncbi:uncharacterized protein CLUP02_15153 [Colletotrichum lupini]|uniref:Uncharacterized protein n=1 Tax=Colletotrichum lupini TaxID=145971 RepID=A0A9Q8T5P1_9PEZI|nr:uncharacterized protein CLUP02_15153 [Colletotrichum lupini]UQC89622.1 hypothetical protein CLUP02_15153 [Colletotrichum lupini]